MNNSYHRLSVCCVPSSDLYTSFIDSAYAGLLSVLFQPFCDIGIVIISKMRKQAQRGWAPRLLLALACLQTQGHFPGKYTDPS